MTRARIVGTTNSVTLPKSRLPNQGRGHQPSCRCLPAFNSPLALRCMPKRGRCGIVASAFCVRGPELVRPSGDSAQKKAALPRTGNPAMRPITTRSAHIIGNVRRLPEIKNSTWPIGDSRLVSARKSRTAGEYRNTAVRPQHDYCSSRLSPMVTLSGSESVATAFATGTV